jgi:hypothetical protein
MSVPWTIAFYENDDEGCPVQGFLDALDTKRRAKLLAMIRLLEEQGTSVLPAASSSCSTRLRSGRSKCPSGTSGLRWHG